VTTTPRLVKSLTQVNTSDAPVNPDSDDSQLDGQVAPLADGGYVVVWTDGSGTHNFSGTAIVGQRYDSLGNKVAGEVKISQFSSGDQSSPAITALPNGNVAIAFVDSFQGDQDLIVRIFGSGGASLDLVRTDFIATGPNQAFNPSLTAFADGSYVSSCHHCCSRRCPRRANRCRPERAPRCLRL
jgi:large repetitive protein